MIHSSLPKLKSISYTMTNSNTNSIQYNSPESSTGSRLIPKIIDVGVLSTIDSIPENLTPASKGKIVG